MKRPSEGEFGAALRAIDLRLYVFKPGDDMRNWKPCDYMVWLAPFHGARTGDTFWFEVKDTDAVNTFSFKELRPAQRQGIADAVRVGIPYWLAVYWRRHQSWTISDATRLVAYAVDPATKSVSRELLMSRFGVQSSKALLSSTLKSILLGEV